MLRAHFPDLQNELNSLQSLYSVVLCIQWMKQDVSHVRLLRPLQEKHMKNFVCAYTSDAVRPKMHFALHTETQCRTWSRLLDTFVCERKHKTYKSQCGRTFSKLCVFSKSVLLHLASHDIRTATPVERLTGQLLGKETEDPVTARTVQIPADSLFAKGLEFKCVSYLQGQNICKLQPRVPRRSTLACFPKKTKVIGFLLNLCFLRTKMQTACTSGNAQHVDDAIFCQQVNSSTGNCHNLFVKQNALFASCSKTQLALRKKITKRARAASIFAKNISKFHKKKKILASLK